MKTYVIDASIILGYFLESHPQAVKQLPDLLRTKLISSSLLPLEIANGLRFSLKNQENAHQIFKKFTALPIKTIKLKPQSQLKALELAYKNNTTVYDTAYHVLAISRNATFLTCDQDYYKKSRHLSHIKLLK